MRASVTAKLLARDRRWGCGSSHGISRSRGIENECFFPYVQRMSFIIPILDPKEETVSRLWAAVLNTTHLQ
jgi:hypothetical protein